MKLGRLEVEITGSRVTFQGRIDDGSPLGTLAAQIPPGDVTLDTSGITFVNSIGMREWIRMLRVLRERGVVTLERVGDVLMTQMNLVPELADSKTLRIASFHAQYACPKCGGESAPVVDAIANAEALRRLAPPRLPCPECGADMELGDFPERYLTVFRS
ncbi:MAG: zinc ribbon domain-containing protein [Kofleriaceae bacterium]